MKLPTNIKAIDKKTKFEYDVVGIFYKDGKVDEIRCDFEENEGDVFEFKDNDLIFKTK